MKQIVTLICILCSVAAHAQNFNPEVRSLPKNIQSADFAFLESELKGRNVVLLGELTHFDGNVFEVKTKIVEYLVNEMGFTTITFESGIYDLWDAQQKIDRGEDVEQAFRNSLFPIWGKTLEFQSFIRFFEANKNRLKLFGFDCQLTGDNSPENLASALYAYCKANKLKFGLKQEDFALLLESATKSGMFDEEDISYEDYNKALSRLHTQITNRPANKENFYWKQIVKSLIVLGEDTKNSTDIVSAFSTTAADNNRDRQMADNLLAYIKMHPEEKIICWGANAHFANDISSISTTVLKDFVPMGAYLKKELKNNVYSLAAVTAADSVHILNKWHKTPVQANSFESFLKGKKVRHAFISSNQPEMNKMKSNRLFSPITFAEANIAQLHDGYLYFDETTPSTFIEPESAKSVAEIMYGNETEETPSSTAGTLPKSDYTLEEIVVYGKRTPYQILEKAIKSRGQNYPDDAFNSTLYTNVWAKVDGATLLDFEFIADQYDFGYVRHTDRSTKKLREIRWKKNEFFKTESLREYHSLVFSSPIQYASVLASRKFKKFDLTLEEVIETDDDEVYVISFSSPRNHSTYTKRVFLSNYSGYIYINKKDNAVIKLQENWEVNGFPESFQTGYALTGDYSKYVTKEYTTESTLSDFTKINGRYYLTHSTNSIAGKVKDINGNLLPFEIETESYWYDFITGNPVKIRYSEEEHLFGNVKYDEVFWKNYKLPVN